MEKKLAQPYRPHLSLPELRDAESLGLIRTGYIRVNQRKYEQCFVPASDGGSDIFFDGLYARNRALDGDLVAYQIQPRSKWKRLSKVDIDSAGERESTLLQRTGEVVAILEKRHPRIGVGRVLMYDLSDHTALVSLRDHRLPRLLVPLSDFPNDLTLNFSLYRDALFALRITGWEDDDVFASGELVRHIGKQGDLAVETEAILVQNQISDAPFSDAVNADLPTLPYTIPAKERKSRKDLTGYTVFTIDPDTAKDLDDALHWRQLGDGKFEIGVHIADVTYFVKPGTAVDKEASKRMTSTFLVDRVVKMLPSVLSEQLCSLIPHQEHLAVSLIWTIDKDFNVVDEWAGRTIINPKAKLSYRVAQEILDEPQQEWKGEYLGCDDCDVQKIVQALVKLRKFTSHVRDMRLRKGSLTLRSNVAHKFVLDEDGFPVSCQVQEGHGSNTLVEELMLMANIAVAHRLHTSQPDTAVLRKHERPKQTELEGVAAMAKSLGYNLDVTSSQTLEESLLRLEDGTELGAIRHRVFSRKLLIAMNPAQYICHGLREKTGDPHHYALNVPLYTHFTSPIRRYADVLVHRQLLASINGEKVPTEDASSLQDLCQLANVQKLRAKIASDDSNHLYYRAFVKKVGGLEVDAIVTDVLSEAFDVFLLSNSGINGRVYMNSLPLVEFSYTRRKLQLFWQLDEGDEDTDHDSSNAGADTSVVDQRQEVQLFDKVRVVVQPVQLVGSSFGMAMYLKPPPGCSSCFIVGGQKKAND